MKKRKLKKIYIILLIVFILLIFFGAYYFVRKYEIKKENERQAEEARQKEVLRIKTLEKNYSIRVKLNKETTLYKKEENNYKKSGSISKNMLLELEEIDVKKYKDEYIKLKNIDYYVNYKDISKDEKEENIWSKRYKNYIPFNQNVIVNNVALYLNDEIKYKIEEELSLPIIIDEIDRYYVEYDDKLVYVLKSDDIKVIESNNTTEESTTHLAIINYHFIYNPETDFDCDSSLCMTTNEFESHIKLLSDEGYFTLNTEELDRFIDKKIRLPKKSVMVTEDDGWYAFYTSKILEKYNKNGVLFLMTGSYKNAYSSYKTPYLEVHSHGHDLHVGGECSGGSRGARILCLNHDLLIADLKNSSADLDGSTIFCYPFYEYNEYAIEALKEAGYTMAFAGGGRDVYQGENKYKIPRYGIPTGMSLNSLRRIITVK